MAERRASPREVSNIAPPPPDFHPPGAYESDTQAAPTPASARARASSPWRRMLLSFLCDVASTLRWPLRARGRARHRRARAPRASASSWSAAVGGAWVPGGAGLRASRRHPRRRPRARARNPPRRGHAPLAAVPPGHAGMCSGATTLPAARLNSGRAARGRRRGGPPRAAAGKGNGTARHAARRSAVVDHHRRAIISVAAAMGCLGQLSDAGVGELRGRAGVSLFAPHDHRCRQHDVVVPLSLVDRHPAVAPTCTLAAAHSLAPPPPCRVGTRGRTAARRLLLLHD